MGIKLRFTRIQVVEFEDESDSPESVLALNLKNAKEMPEHVFDDAETVSLTGIIVGDPATPSDDLCALCHKPMADPSVVNAIFGAHEVCLKQERADVQLAQATWDAICNETAQGGDRPSADIIKGSFDLLRAIITNHPATPSVEGCRPDLNSRSSQDTYATTGPAAAMATSSSMGSSSNQTERGLYSMSNQPEPARFDFSFRLQPRIAKRGSACGSEKTFGSLVHQALGCNTDSGLGRSRRFERRWTDRQFREALKDVWNHGYRIVSVIKERAPLPGTTPEFQIEDSDLYEGFGSDMKLKGFDNYDHSRKRHSRAIKRHNRNPNRHRGRHSQAMACDIHAR